METWNGSLFRTCADKARAQPAAFVVLHAANAAISRWLREVANTRVHATIGEIPAERLLIAVRVVDAPYAARRGGECPPAFQARGSRA
jgi:hypothetical protein